VGADVIDDLTFEKFEKNYRLISKKLQC
jgi:hypothetical protein